MKKSLFILLLSLLTTISCEKGGYPPRNYSIEMQILDLNNNDLIKGVRYSTSEYTNDDQYQISQSDFNCISKTEDIASYNSSINPNKNPQTITLYASTPPYRPHLIPTEIKFEMVCHHIFKDVEKHEITTKWSYNKIDGICCIGVSINGKEFIPTNDKTKNTNYVNIVLD